MATVGGSVGVLEAEMIRRRTRDVQLPSMDRAMVDRAEADLVLRSMGAPLRTRLNVMHVERDGVSAARDLTHQLVTEQNLAPNGRRHRSGNARRRRVLIVSRRPVGEVDLPSQLRQRTPDPQMRLSKNLNASANRSRLPSTAQLQKRVEIELW